MFPLGQLSYSPATFFVYTYVHSVTHIIDNIPTFLFSLFLFCLKLLKGQTSVLINVCCPPSLVLCKLELHSYVNGLNICEIGIIQKWRGEETKTYK